MPLSERGDAGMTDFFYVIVSRPPGDGRCPYCGAAFEVTPYDKDKFDGELLLDCLSCEKSIHIVRKDGVVTITRGGES